MSVVDGRSLSAYEPSVDEVQHHVADIDITCVCFENTSGSWVVVEVSSVARARSCTLEPCAPWGTSLRQWHLGPNFRMIPAAGGRKTSQHLHAFAIKSAWIIDPSRRILFSFWDA